MPRIEKEEKDLMVALYTRGYTIRQIMAHLSRSYGGVHTTLFLAGVQFRKTGRKKKL